MESKGTDDLVQYDSMTVWHALYLVTQVHVPGQLTSELVLQ